MQGRWARSRLPLQILKNLNFVTIHKIKLFTKYKSSLVVVRPSGAQTYNVDRNILITQMRIIQDKKLIWRQENDILQR